LIRIEKLPREKAFPIKLNVEKQPVYFETEKQAENSRIQIQKGRLLMMPQD